MAIGISIRLYDGATAKASVTGITALWWDTTTVYDFGVPVGRTTAAATDGDGDLELDLSDVSGLAVDDWGYLVLRKEDGSDHRDSLIFSGRVQVTTVTGATKLAYSPNWTRPTNWSALSDVTGGNKFSGLYAVFPKGPNWCAFKFTCSDSSQYTVDWGDTTANENINSAASVYHSFDYANCSDNDVGKADEESCTFADTGDKINIANHSYRDGTLVAFSEITTTTGISTATLYYVVNPTKAVTFQDSGDTVTLAAHGYANGETVRFDRITTTTGISIDTSYYVVGAATDTFQVSDTLGGSAKALTTNGSGVLFKNDYFKVADTIGGTAKTLTTDGSGKIYRCKYRQAVVDVVPTTGGKNFTALDLNIRHTSASSDAAVDYTTGWLDIALDAASMTTLDVVGSATLNCTHGMLEQFSAANLGTITDWANQFRSCYVLKSIPALDTTGGTDFSNLFRNCYKLETIPLIDTSAATTVATAFYQCFSLMTIPLINISSATSTNSMFYACSSLTTVPLLNTKSVTNFSGMFQVCYSLKEIPLLNTSAGTNFSSMLASCTSLQTIPMLDTSAGTNFTSMFNSCASLQAIPALDVSAGTDFTTIFTGCYSLQVGRLNGTAQNITYPAGQLSGAELNEIYRGLATVTSKTIIVTGNYGTASDDPTIASDSKGWTVTA